MKLLSLFSGSGGFELAGAMCGITPVAASEVEPYPIAVTRSRFPNMKHLGDVSKINGAEIEPVDIITFGSPCQDMSVAGKQAGIKHADNGDDETTRSGLFMEAVRIIKEMRKATDGKYPRFAIWENVPGAFSSNVGQDFRLVLEELIKITEPTAVMPEVPKKGWAYADCYFGDGWSLAYRVLDAQYWGVPQRRRRIYLAADFRGECARQILFEREGLRGYSAESGTPWKAVTSDAERSVGADDREGEISYTLKIRSGCEGGGNVPMVIEPFCKSRRAKSADDATTWKHAKVANTLDTFDQGEARANEVVVMGANAIYTHPQNDTWTFENENKVQTLSASMGMGGGNTPLVMETETHGVVYAVDQGAGKSSASVTEDFAPTLTCTHDGAPVVALDRASFNQGQNAKYDFEISEEGVNSTLVARGPSAVAYSFDPGASRDVGALFIEECGKTITNGTCPGHHDGVVIATTTGSYMQVEEGRSPTLMARDDKDPTCVEFYDEKTRNYIVRRLTPTECARLQGFPDRWGDVVPKVEFSDEEYQFWLDVRHTYEVVIKGKNPKNLKDYTKKQMLTWYNKLHTDSAEYKMWGNGIALPCALYVMEGIAEAMKQ